MVWRPFLFNWRVQGDDEESGYQSIISLCWSARVSGRKTRGLPESFSYSSFIRNTDFDSITWLAAADIKNTWQASSTPKLSWFLNAATCSMLFFEACGELWCRTANCHANEHSGNPRWKRAIRYSTPAFQFPTGRFLGGFIMACRPVQRRTALIGPTSLTLPPTSPSSAFTQRL